MTRPTSGESSSIAATLAGLGTTAATGDPTRFCVTWAIYPGPGPDRKPERGCYAPPGGLTADEADATVERVGELARANGIRLPGEHDTGRQMYLTTQVLPHHDDLSAAWGDQ